MATKYDQTPTSINTPELEAQTAETLAAEQERAERLHRAAEVMGSLATEEFSLTETDETTETVPQAVVIEGNFGTTEQSVQAELKRLEEEAKARIEELNQQQEQLAA